MNRDKPLRHQAADQQINVALEKKSFTEPATIQRIPSDILNETITEESPSSSYKDYGETLETSTPSKFKLGDSDDELLNGAQTTANVDGSPKIGYIKAKYGHLPVPMNGKEIEIVRREFRNFIKPQIREIGFECIRRLFNFFFHHFLFK